MHHVTMPPTPTMLFPPFLIKSLTHSMSSAVTFLVSQEHISISNIFPQHGESHTTCKLGKRQHYKSQSTNYIQFSEILHLKYAIEPLSG